MSRAHLSGDGEHRTMKTQQTTFEPLPACDGSVSRCESCNRLGKLVMQEPHTLHGQRWVFRAYLCPWHLAASNKWRNKMGPNFKRLTPIEYKPDAELLSQNAE
jgi:hypothetical protein